MDRNNGRYTYIRRQGQQQHNAPHNQHHSTSSLSSSSSSTSSNNNQHYDNHRNSNNSVSSTSSSSQYSSSNNTNNSSSLYTTSHSQTSLMSREPQSQHDELIRYIREAWTKVSEQGTPVVYCNESDHQLKNFKPFNLEEYWGQRVVQNIHVSHGGHQ